MGRVLTWEHKHGREMYTADTDEQLEKAARKVLHTLIDWRYVGDWDDDYPTIKLILDGDEPVLDDRSREMTAWRILEQRSGYEYEIFDLEYTTDVDDDDA